MTEIVLKEDKGIIYEILQEKDLEETSALIAEVFSKGEPVTRSLEITAEEFYFFAEIYCKKAVREGLSIIAKDKGKVIGFSIQEDFDTDQPEGIKKIDQKIVPVMALVDAIEKDIKCDKKEGEHRFHMFLGGIAQLYENRHIATTLIEESLKMAKIKHFTSVIVEPSGLATQHMFIERLGFKQKRMIEYKKFLYEGKNVFKNIEGPIGLLLLEKML